MRAATLGSQRAKEVLLVIQTREAKTKDGRHDQLLQDTNAETIRTPMRVYINFTARGRYIEGTTVDDEEHVGDGCGASSAGPLMISMSYSSLKMISGYEGSRWA